MTGINHVVAGALIAAALPQPALAIPLAFASHFVMDALPHYGDTSKHSWLNGNFKYILGADLVLAGMFILGLALWQPAAWGLMIICAVIAYSPDFLWLPYYIAHLKNNHKVESRLIKFMKRLQWGERPWGIIVEAAVLATLFMLFLQIVR